MDLEELLDSIQALRAKRDSIVAMYDDAIETKRAKLVLMMKDRKEKKVQGELATAYFKPTETITVGDWNEVFKFVKAKGAFDILQRRLSLTALKNRIKAGEKIKGVAVVEGDPVLTIRSKKEESEDAE